MTITTGTLASHIHPEKDSALVEDLLNRLFPICRSITGSGFRKSFDILSEIIPFKKIEVRTGTRVFDWTVPEEWEIRDAYIKNAAGERVVDFQKSNLHVVSYSVPFHGTLTLEELRPHLHSLPQLPKAVPYLTSYYERSWGFCLSHEQYLALEEGRYEVCIDSRISKGSVLLGECVLKGDSPEEIFLSTYCCHPSMANNELSGPVVMAMIYKVLASLPRRRYTYRFYMGPETIGALSYLSLRGKQLKQKVKGGFVLTCCGDPGAFTYKQVRAASNSVDRSVIHALKHSQAPYKVLPFFPTGSDERQWSSPGFNLPMGSLMRSMYGTYPEYHSSLDDLNFITIPALMDSVRMYLNCINVLEQNTHYLNLKPFGEPMLGRYALHNTLGGRKEPNQLSRQIRFILNFSDGDSDLLDIAEKLGKPIWELEPMIERLCAAKLLKLKKTRKTK